MAKQSYIATSEGQLAVREAIAYHGFTQQQLAVAANLRTRSSVSKLINGKPVERQIFQRICQCLELDFRAIAGLQLSFTSIKEGQPILSPTPELSTGLIQLILSELNSLKENLQALRDVPSVLAVIEAHIQLLRQSLVLSSELSNAQPIQGPKILQPLSDVELIEPVSNRKPISKEALDAVFGKINAISLVLPGLSLIDEQSNQAPEVHLRNSANPTFSDSEQSRRRNEVSQPKKQLPSASTSTSLPD